MSAAGSYGSCNGKCHNKDRHSHKYINDPHNYGIDFSTYISGKQSDRHPDTYGDQKHRKAIAQ